MSNKIRTNNRKTLMGEVISNKMQKTIIVRVARHAIHPLYKKVMTKTNKFKVHDAKMQAKPGDKVLIMSSRPISKDKHWRLVGVIGSQARGAE
jgi:small subunit ribosomal protein S17